MKGSVTSFVLAALAGVALAAPSRVPTAETMAAHLEAHEALNAVSMEQVMKMKLDQQARDERAGLFAPDRYVLQPLTACNNGKAGEYACNKLDLKGFLRHQDLGSRSRRSNDVWGKSTSTSRTNARSRKPLGGIARGTLTRR